MPPMSFFAGCTVSVTARCAFRQVVCCATRIRRRICCLVVRGGEHSITHAVLERTTSDYSSRYRFFGISVFDAPGDDLVVSVAGEIGLSKGRFCQWHWTTPVASCWTT